VLRDADELLAPALAATISALQLTDDRDAAVVRLAERYVATIDLAANLAAEAERILARVDPDDLTVLDQLAALAVRVERQAVLEKLGPKLLQALVALQATPAARARQRKGGGGEGAGPNRLEELRAARR
jgi:hypothetical protein